MLAFLLLACTIPLDAQQKEKPKWPPSPHIANTDPLRPEDEAKKIKLPPGFELQLVAADPDIRKPININFDAAGRLWLTETIEYPFAAPEGKGRDAVKILEDFGPDGRARKITTFADKLNIPIGVLPTAKGALVYSIPAITHMIDSTGAGKADKREPLYTGFGFKDTHGMTGEFMQGFDGWIYACHGYLNTSNVRAAHAVSGKGDSITMTSGNTYRIKADGSRIEQWTWGQVNPFGMAFDPCGNLYTGDCHSQPLTMLLRHGWYVSFNRPNDGLGFAPHMNTFGSEHSTALCGVTYYAADQYPKEYQGMLFLGDVVTNRINAYRLDWTGASPKAVVQDFLVSSDPWFRPVDVKLGPDGCLYFADFYNRIIGHYEVDLKHPGRDRDKGRIWRIVYRGKDGKSGPQPVVNLAKADVKTLVQSLGHANLTVRLQATHQLVERGGAEAVDVLQVVNAYTLPGGGARKAHALWALDRLGKLDDESLARAASAPDREVRVHAQRILTEKASWTPKYAAIAKLGLEDKEPMVQRVAAEALGAHPAVDQVKPLVALWQKVPTTDTHLTYAVRLALRDQLRNDETWTTLKLADWPKDEQRAIANVCLGVNNAASAEFLQSYVERYEDNSAAARDYIHYIVRRGGPDSVRWAMDLIQKKYTGGAQGLILKAVVQGAQERGVPLSKDERSAAEAIVLGMLAIQQGETLKSGVELADMMKLAKTQPQLLALTTKAKDPALTKACVKALVNIDAKQARESLSQIILDAKLDPKLRGQIARDLGNTNHPEAQAALLKALETAPARLETDIAVGLTGNQQGCEKLLQAIAAGKAPASALNGRAIYLNFQAAKVKDFEARLAKLGRPADPKIQEQIGKRRDSFASFQSDPAIGQKVFQKSCANCHQIANQGAKVGPNLDGIGTRGLERLLEDVLDPNRNVDQAFRTTVITTKSGQTLSGLFLREEGNVVILADKDGKDVRIEKGQIDERAVSPMSPMPANFLETLSEPELHHLMAYLLGQRGKK
jgi:putative membrane-bound dehydrogenase-like protein